MNTPSTGAAAAVAGAGAETTDDRLVAPAPDIPHDELHVEVVWPKERGGQHVGTVQGPVRVTHLPTGTVAEYGSARSQHINKMIALDMVLSALTHPRHRP